MFPSHFKIITIKCASTNTYSQILKSEHMDKMQSAEDKKRRKQLIMNRIKQANIKPEQSIPQPSFKPEPKGPMRIDTEEDFRKMPYEGKAKYDNELKALNALKNENPQVNQKPKKFFYEHYSTDLPYDPHIQNNNNPSGRPPNIPPEMYEGITVKPKRPWVHLGTQNLPPVVYEELNQSQFKSVAKKNIEAKKDDAKKGNQPDAGKPRKKAVKKQDSGQDEQSAFNMSDEMEIEDGDSIFASKFEGQSKISKSKVSKRSSMKNSQNYLEDDDDMVSDGTETKKRHISLFNDNEDEDEDDDGEYFDDMNDENIKNNSKNKPMKSKKDAKAKKRDEHKQNDSDDQ